MKFPLDIAVAAISVVAVIATLLLTLLLTGCGPSPSTPDPGSTTSPPPPGNAETYARIASTTDCSVLQLDFDSFAAVHDASTPGSERATVAVAYMEAADARMIELGCAA